MKVVALVSGGKDSCYAMMRCIAYGHEVGHRIITSYAECMGLPLFRRRISGSTRHSHLSYSMTPGDEVEDMFILLSEIKQKFPYINAVSSGAIASDYQRLRVESVCSRLGLVSLAYLWKQDQTLLLDEMIEKGIVAIIIKVAAMGLVPAKHLGKELADLQPHLLQMKEFCGINVCGEGGEYETLTLDCPLFTNARIVLDKFQILLHSPDSIAPVGVLHPIAFHLEYKTDISSLRGAGGNLDGCSDKMGCVHVVEGSSTENCIVRCQSSHLVPDNYSYEHLRLCISTTKRDVFSVGCWIEGPSLGLPEDLTAVLWRIESLLRTEGFDWVDVLYIHLYISDMKHFALANEVYVKFITEKKCSLGVPSRSTIELPLKQVGYGHAYVEVLVASDRSKRVLHVQSISCWAPSCIGPYSQATLDKEVLYMAGQLGLDPPTMALCAGGLVAELVQALENSEAVANCFNSSLASAILIVVYCSAYLQSSERYKIQQMITDFIKQKVSEMQTACMRSAFDPIFLYVLAPDLPKGALVEVKPVLHIPENSEVSVETNQQQAHNKKPHDRVLEYARWHDSCCQKCIVSEKICAVLVSVTKDVVADMCGTNLQIAQGFEANGFVKDMKTIVKFCINLLDKILVENNFSWEDLKSLRVYFTTDLSTTVDVLSLTISEVLGEFVEVGKRAQGNGTIFNLIPVLGSGGSSSMDDLITCELFASKL
ncbi:Diphthine--ammonia ligase protein [Dioscorea alata]|uniref:Diphthine--ammonia ligase protein n=1 Tax=Dioscorea alata TaxID=55571 RepID=A0ACB7V8P9_DIOAL|nr:Diphthine--ammonia ligase protein [Dioscorea alata]